MSFSRRRAWFSWTSSPPVDHVPLPLAHLERRRQLVPQEVVPLLDLVGQLEDVDLG